MKLKLYRQDCRDAMAAMPENSVDAIVTDPPYGLDFMGRGWDHGVPGRSFWKAALRVTKPGGYIFAFGGSRLFHRMTCSIEDAGWEVRDVMSWLYGSGFPKSLDVSKAIDRQRGEDKEPVRRVCRYLRAAMDAAGLNSRDLVPLFNCHSRLVDHWAARDTDSQPNLPTVDQWETLRAHGALNLGAGMDAEVWRLNGRKGEPGEDWLKREKVGATTLRDTGVERISVAGAAQGLRGYVKKEVDLTAPATPLAQQFNGYGTALKPAHEDVLIARKPHSAEWPTMIGSLELLEAKLCLLLSDAARAENPSTSSRSDAQLRDIARWDVDAITRTRAASYGPTATSRSDAATITCLSIVRSWRRTLIEASTRESTSIIGTATALTIDWRTLRSSLSEITPGTIIRAEMEQPGSMSRASHAALYSSAAVASIASTLALSALGTATGKEPTSRLDEIAGSFSPAWEPIVVAMKPTDGTFAENAQRHGLAGLNIDGGRVGGDPAYIENCVTQGVNTAQTSYEPRRERRTFEPSTAGRWPANVVLDEEAARQLGDPSRYFYSAKASKKDRAYRDAEGVEQQSDHPTVKPLALMRWLVRLATPPRSNTVILDPFTGSGSTGVACALEGVGRFVGCERVDHFADIAEARIRAAIKGAASKGA